MDYDSLMLHITNGDAVVERWREVGLPGSYLPWRDVLSDGPVPDVASLEALSDIRAGVLEESFGGVDAALRAGLAERDGMLADFRRHDEVVLWFEHDLYDQLQLIQILDWFADQDRSGVSLSLIQIGEHPEVPDFHGLGELTGAQLVALLPARVPVTPAHLALARDAWEAFRSQDPTRLEAIAAGRSPELPFLGPAFRRFLEEYPSTRNGLSRLEREILEACASGATTRREIYRHSQQHEDCPWGDLSVFLRLDRLADARTPAIERRGSDEFMLTPLGKRLLDSQDDWLRASGHVDLWLGGVHLTDAESAWRWDESNRRLCRPEST